MALAIYKQSPACYRLFRRMFALPSQGSLHKLLNRMPLKPGINGHIFSALKKMAQNHDDQNNIDILSFGEIFVKNIIIVISIKFKVFKSMVTVAKVMRLQLKPLYLYFLV